MDNADNIIKKFTNKECFNILKDLIVHKKAGKDTYTLIMLWLTGLLNKRQYAHLRTLAGGNIIAKDINSNTDELIELVHEIIYELIKETVDYAGVKKGLRHKVAWDEIPITNKVTGEVELVPIEGNEGRIVSYINTAFRYILPKVLGKSYRGSVNYSNYNNISKKEEMIKFRERLLEEDDPGAVTPDVIKKLRLEGFFPGKCPESGEDMFDVRLYQYRNIYSLGDLRNFTALTEEIEMKGSLLKDLKALTSADKHKKFLYEQIITILNSDIMPKLNREFLKCYFGIPSIIEFDGTRKVFDCDMILFFELYPEYKKVLKVKRISYSRRRRNIKWVNDENIIPSSQLYKDSISMLKKLLAPAIDMTHQEYQNDLESARELIHAYNQPLDLGSDLHFIEMSEVDLEGIANE